MVVRLSILVTAAFWVAVSVVHATNLGPEIVVSALDNVQGVPAVAFAEGPDEYLVVWENQWGGDYRDIYAQRIAADGTLLSNFSVASLPNSSRNPAVAYDPTRDRYLVVWSTESSTFDYLDLYGRFIPRVAPDPSLTEFLIDSRQSYDEYPDVEFALAQDEFMVVWAKTYLFNPEVFGRRIAADGSGFPDTTFSLMIPNFGEAGSDLAYNLNRNEYLLTFSAGDLTDPWDVFAVRITADGTALGGGLFPVADWADGEGSTAVASCHGLDGYLVVWQNSQTDIYARFVTGDGVVDGPPIHIEDKPFNDLWADVACSHDGSHYLVTWQSEYPSGLSGVWARAVMPNHVADSKLILSPPTLNSGSTDPAVAAGAGGFLITWAHGREDSSWVDIHARTANPVLFHDGFESGDTGHWWRVMP